MDHIALTKALGNNQENNTLLLNAIKSKFAAETAHEEASFSPPKFKLPTLNVAAGGGSKSNVPKKADESLNEASQLSQFLRQKLQETQCKQDKTISSSPSNGFVLPKLQFGSNKLGASFQFPVLKTSQPSCPLPNGLSSLTTAIDNLHVRDCDEAKSNANANTSISPHSTPAIDLSAALASKSPPNQGTPPTRDSFAKTKTQDKSAENFDIPFIDCDRLDVNGASSKEKLDIIKSNEYCVLDISHKLLNNPFGKKKPSCVGKFLCLVEKPYMPAQLKCIISAQEYKLQVKNIIEPFQFDTQSPDDKVLESLRKIRNISFH